MSPFNCENPKPNQTNSKYAKVVRSWLPTITGGSSDVAAAKGAAFGKREKKDIRIPKYKNTWDTKAEPLPAFKRVQHLWKEGECQDGLVTSIPSHGAVARSVAARAHTAFPACNLRLTSNLPSFINLTVNLSRRRRSTYKTPLSLSSTSSTTASLAVYRRSVLKLFISPH